MIPNAGFESWVDVDTFTAQKPESWRPDSTLTYLRKSYPSPVFKSSEAADGDFALGMKSILINGMNVSDSIRCTFIFKGRPGALMGNFKNSPGRTISVRIALTARDGNNQFYILSNDSLSVSDAGGWRPFIIPIHYQTSDISYKAEICMYSDGADTTGYSLIDRLSFSTYNTLEPLPNDEEQEYIGFKIFRSDGRFILLGEGKCQIQHIALIPGLYIIQQSTKTGTYCYKFIQNSP